MKKLLSAMICVALFLASPAFAAEDPLTKGMGEAIDNFAVGCQAELTTFCRDVTPGEGRILACLYAFGDKVSSRCEYALYDSISQLNRTLASVSYAITECGDDLDAYCADIQVGEGRLLDCIKRNEGKVSTRCMTALKDVGWVK